MNKKNWIEKRITINWVEYKLNRVVDATQKDIHHTIWLSLRHQWYDVNNPINKQVIQRRKHIALNNFFWWEAQAPHLQLRQCLELRKDVLSDWVREELYTLLTLDREDFYKEELIKEKRKWKPLFDDLKNKNLKK